MTGRGMDMDRLLCDDLLQEIFSRFPNSSSSSVSLVSRRWLHLFRTSRTHLSLDLDPRVYDPTLASLSSLLSHYPFLSYLSIILPLYFLCSPDSVSFSNHLLHLVSCYCSKLRYLRFLAGPVNVPSLVSLSSSCSFLGHIDISLPRPLHLNWVASFPCLKELSVYVLDGDEVCRGGLVPSEGIDASLRLESVSLTGIRRDDVGVGWLWRSCKNLNNLQLKCCEGIGDGGSFRSFNQCLKGLQALELRASRSVVDGVLSKLAENCESLTSLLVYDGGSSDGLLHMIRNCRFDLRKLYLRLPLDLTSRHLLAVAANFRGLVSIRLESCCLVTGEGLKALGIALSSGIQELGLINCDVVENEPELLATLGQSLRNLRRLNLSYNDLLTDKELTSMLVSCNCLIELKLRGCKRLTSVAAMCIIKSCKGLQSIDIIHCPKIKPQYIEQLIVNLPLLKCIKVDESQLSDTARSLLASKFIESKFTEIVA